MCDRKRTLKLDDAAVVLIDRKGYVYCTDHGIARRGWHPCRKLLVREVATLSTGGTIAWARS